MPFAPSHPQLFAPHINSEFSLARPDGTACTLTLESVDTSIDDDVQLSFSLLFRSSDPDLPQGIYTLTHKQLGECTLSVVPVRHRRGTIRHESVMNLLRPAAGGSFPG